MKNINKVPFDTTAATSAWLAAAFEVKTETITKQTRELTIPHRTMKRLDFCSSSYI
jgi:hypothetical protein